MSTPLDAARAYLRRGWRSIPVPFHSKKPILKGWEALRLDEPQLPEYFNGRPSNIGGLLGEPSGGLLDVDLDVPEAAALADAFLPQTACEFGRASKLRSHRLYIADPLVETTKFSDIEKQAAEKTAMIVEIRSTGAQTLFPGSEHESGEPIEFSSDGDPARVDGTVLLTAVRSLALAAMLLRHWPAKGNRHEAVLAASGFLQRGGLEVAVVTQILSRVARAADPSADLTILRWARSGRLGPVQLARGPG